MFATQSNSFSARATDRDPLMTIGNGISGTTGLAFSGVYPFKPVANRTGPLQPASPTPAARPADAIRFSPAAVPGVPAVSGVYGTTGLQATSPAGALEAIGRMVAARVSPTLDVATLDFASGRGVAREGALPFYTNPTVANGVATSTSVARLGRSLDTTG